MRRTCAGLFAGEERCPDLHPFGTENESGHNASGISDAPRGDDGHRHEINDLRHE